MKRDKSKLMVRSGNQAMYATGKLATTIAFGIVAMLLMVGVSALIQVRNNSNNIKKLTP
jgi:hypothetical protein